MEVYERSVRTYISDDGKYWFASSGISFPENTASEDFIKHIGIIGVGGDMAGKPIFSAWEEKAFSRVYRNDDFSGRSLHRHWMLGQTNSGWGSEQVEFEQNNGTLAIHPFSGSDVYLGNENYPFAASPSPREKTWIIEVKIQNFDPRSPGKWNKGGVVLWRGNRHYAVLALVKDEDRDQMYFETLVMGGFYSVKTRGFAAREKTDAFLRFEKLGKNRFSFQASYDRKNWFDLGEYHASLYEPQIRLFASGDIKSQKYRQIPEKAALVLHWVGGERRHQNRPGNTVSPGCGGRFRPGSD